MGRWRCPASVSLLLLVSCLFVFTPASATLMEGKVTAFGGRRGLLQAPTTPTTSTPVPPTPTTPIPIPPTPGVPGNPGPVLPGPSPFVAPAPAPMGVTNRQRLNAIIAGSVVSGVLVFALVCIFCRCRCCSRGKKLPFQRLQMT